MSIAVKNSDIPAQILLGIGSEHFNNTLIWLCVVSCNTYTRLFNRLCSCNRCSCRAAGTQLPRIRYHRAFLSRLLRLNTRTTYRRWYLVGGSHRPAARSTCRNRFPSNMLNMEVRPACLAVLLVLVCDGLARGDKSTH